MILMEKNRIKSNRSKLKRIYINTLIPCFKFRTKNGSVIAPKMCSVVL